MAQASLKILVLGDVRGQFKKLFSRIAKVHKAHGPFDAVFCVGTFFADALAEQPLQELEPYLQGKKTVPVPTYFILGQESSSLELVDKLPNGGPICTNLEFLGTAGAQTLAPGNLRVAFLSGVFDPVLFDKPQDDAQLQQAGYTSAYTSADVSTVIEAAGREPVDLLLTAEWGRGYHHLLGDDQLPADINAPKSAGSLPVARLAAQVSARYHMAGGQNAFFVLPPYLTRAGGACRFYGLAILANPKKRKDMFALSLNMITNPDGSRGMEPPPEGSTSCPYLSSGTGVGVGSVRKSPDPDDSREPSEAEESTAKRMKLAAQGDLARFSGDFMNDPAGAAYNRWDIAGARADLKRPPPKYVCRRCNQSGHFIQDCPMPRPPPEGYVCRKCEGTDHFIRDCPEIVKEKAARGDGPPPGYICHKCNQTGHLIQRCPLVLEEQATPGGSKTPGPDYVCRKCNLGGHFIRDCPEFAKQQQHIRSKDCWFCLGTPTVESHLIISIATQMYMAMAKGPLCSSHVLLMPIQHRSSSLELSEEETADLLQYKQAIRKWFASQRCQALFYERYLPTKNAQHMHIQCIPVPNAAADQIAEVITRQGQAASGQPITFQSFPSLQAFQELLRQMGPPEASEDAGADAPSSRPFIAFEMLDGSVLVHLPAARRGDLFVFARQVCAELLGTPEKANWKTCQMTVEQETEATDNLKNAFAAFDFVEDDDEDDGEE